MSTSNSIDGIFDAGAMSSIDGSGVKPVSWEQTKSNLMDWTKGMCSWTSEHQEDKKLGISSSILSLSHLNVNFDQAWVILCLDGAECSELTASWERGRQDYWNLKKLAQCAWHVSCKIFQVLFHRVKVGITRSNSIRDQISNGLRWPTAKRL